MRKLSLLLLALGMAIASLAQTGESVNSQQDKLEIEGFTVRILPALRSGYGYSIQRGNVMVVHQMRNPFTMSDMGLRKKEDVYKVARWHVKDLKSKQAQSPDDFRSAKPTTNVDAITSKTASNRGVPSVQVNPPLPVKIAQELGIDLRK